MTEELMEVPIQAQSLPTIHRARLISFEPFLPWLVAAHGAVLVMAGSGSPASWVAVGSAAFFGILGLVRSGVAGPRGFGMVASIAGIAAFTGGIHSSVTVWLAVATLVYPAIVPWSGAYLAWGVAWYLPLVVAGGNLGTAVIRAGLVAGGGAVAWGLGATTQQLVGEKEHTESQLRETQGRFSAAFDHASSGMIMFDIDGSTLRANQAMADFVGRPLDEIHRMDLLDHFHPDERPIIQRKIDELVAGAVWSYQDELRCLHASGRLTWALVGMGLVTSPDGAPEYIFAHFQDIAARVATEESLRANEEHYRTLFGQSPIPIWEVDYTGVEAKLDEFEASKDIRAYLRMRTDLVPVALAEAKLKDANDAALELVEAAGLSESEGRLPLLMADDGTIDALIDQLASIYEGKDRAQGNVSTTSFGGSVIDGILHWAAPVIDGRRDLSRVVVAFADFSEARSARMALKRIEERLRAVVSASPILLFALDRNGVFTLSEGQALQALRLSPGEAVGRSAFELFRDSPALVRAVRQALSGDALTTSADVRGRVLDFRLGPMWEEGNVAGVIGVGNDVTERTRATEQLEQLVRSKDQFVASVSHELRTPLTAVVGFAQELQDGLGEMEPEMVAMLIELVAQQSLEVADLVEDLLVAARSEVDTISVVPEQLELWEQVNFALSAIPGRDGHPTQLVGDPVKVFADPIRLRQILRNLGSNARRHGGENLVVEAWADDDRVVIQVRDDGEGIPVRDRRKIFDPYFRGTATDTAGASVGLGLTVSHQLARRMDGDLVYRFEDGWSTFELTLPAG